jgi:hypothetical protein
MNPEFQRNIWLEFSVRRAIFIAVALGLVFLLGNSTGSNFLLRNSAEYIFYGIVVFWGSRNAAQAVVGEIRERTWDGQRLSSLSPFEMTWGKLFGATSYIWFGGAICLAVFLSDTLVQDGPFQTIADAAYFLSIGFMSQAVAFFASLLSVRRRQSQSRLDVVLYQVAGLIAAGFVWWAWKFITTDDAAGGIFNIEEIRWWGMSIDTASFYLLSLLVFLAWAFVGCYRLMRLELSVQNTPIVWAGFVAFVVFYFAGQGGVEGIDFFGIEIAGVVGPLAIAMFTSAVLTYAAAFAEPKDRVLYRWLVESLTTKRSRSTWHRLQAWMVSYIVTIAIGIVLAVVLTANPPDVFGYRALNELLSADTVSASLGFLTRDIAIILFFALAQNARRGEFPAIITLSLLYFVAPRLIGSVALFWPAAPGDGGVGPILAWGEAALAWFFVYQRARKSVFGIELLPTGAQPERK